jgi:protein-tyrosine phosphatase
MTGFRVLFVCVGNVCRSPLGERLLAAMLPAADVEVSSAGVGALAGAAMDPEAAAHLEAYGASADGFVARQLTPAMVEQSDLVLTATKAIRSRVLEDSPAALRRTFTVLEFAALLDVVPTGGDLAALVRTAADERSRAVLEDYDIRDPFRRGSQAHAAAAEAITSAVERIAKALAR